MSGLGNIVKKELRELMTPATFLPIVIIALIFGSMGNTIGGIEEELEEKPIIGLINMDEGNYSLLAQQVFSANADIIYNSTSIEDKEEAIQQLNEKEGVALIIITEGFSENIEQGKTGFFEVNWIMRGAGILDSISSTVVETLITFVNTNITMDLIQEGSDVNPQIALTPTYINQTTNFKGKNLDGLSPNDVSGILSQQSTFIPIVMMMIIIMAGGTVISSMALEKENKTMETLLTLPVNRFSIVAGKIIASAFIGLILAVIYMFGIGYYMQSFEVSNGVNLAAYNLNLTTSDFLLIGLSVFVTLIAALSLCMLLGTMAKNYKSAQTLTFPVTLLALIPMFLTMFKDFDTLPMAMKGVLFAIPFSHPMMAPRALIFDDYLLVISGIIYVAIFAVILISLAVWVFKTDRIITGSTNPRWKKIFQRRRF